MKSQCLPFSQIPHTTRLFSDFLYDFSKVQQFYPRSPYFIQWVKDEASHLRYDPARRERVCAILERQNQSWNASPKTLENIARLRAGASAVVTGQQVGLFGGPLFSIFKALTAVKLADEATRAGVSCVPIFWLASEDHDLAEINHVSIPGTDGALQNLAIVTQGVADAPVGTIQFGAEIQAVVESAAQLLGPSEAVSFLRDSYRPGENFGSAFARLFTRLFAEWGVILLDASDAEFHAIAQPIFLAAIQQAEEIDEALLVRGRELEAAGYHQQVKVTPSSTLLFVLRDGARIPIQRQANGQVRTTDFLIGDEKISGPELGRRIAAAPQNFSPNVLLRPVVQDYLLPTTAYTGGAAEVAYFAQAGVVYEALLDRVTPIVPRFSATLIDAKLQALLERYDVDVPSVFSGTEQLRERLASHALPPDLQAAFEGAETGLEQSLAAIRDSLARLDKTLIDSAAHAGEKMRYQLSQLRSRAARAELRQTEIVGRHADLLSHTLFPNKTLQEREIAAIYFVSRYGPELLQGLYELINADCLDHQIVSL